jgi:hypothetical protein
VRFGSVHPRQWQSDRFNGWLAYYELRPWAPQPDALQLIIRTNDGRWQDDDRNRRWRSERLDGLPHAPAPQPGRRRRRRS